jgi:hypothetical protein
MIMSLGQLVATGPRDEVLSKMRGNRVTMVQNDAGKRVAA